MIADAHNDFLTAEISPQKRGKIVEKYVDEGLKILNCAVFTTEQNLGIEDVKKFAQEIAKYNAKYNCKFLLSIEDLGFVKTKQDLERLIKLKPISVTLTWNFNNQFAGGALDNGSLTSLGKQVVRVLEQNNIFIDTAHLNKKSFWQFVKITTKPIYCSHSNVYSLHKHKRNMTMKQIKAIVQTDGFLGLTLFNDFISNKGISSFEIAKQFKVLVSQFGTKNFGLGTDFYGCAKDKLPSDVRNYFDIKNIVSHMDSFRFSTKTIVNLLHKNYFCFLKKSNLDKI